MAAAVESNGGGGGGGGVGESASSGGWFRWRRSPCPSSSCPKASATATADRPLSKIAASESRLFATAGVAILSRLLPIRFGRSEIYTVSAVDSTVENSAAAAESPTSQNQNQQEPVVLIHGFGAGCAVWANTIAALARRRHFVHAFDLLGFARSDRPAFSKNETLAELEFVESVEDWRQAMGFERMTLVAHSFGGYIATAYALSHPQRVSHLVLVDPWGFPEKPPTSDKQIRPANYLRVAAYVLSFFNPLAALRVAGNVSSGAGLIRRLRPDLKNRYGSDDIYEYIYECNARQPPTGESAFQQMTYSFGWAKRPMAQRFCQLDVQLPVTFIYGAKSWIDSAPAVELQQARAEATGGVAYTDVKIVRGAGHHVYVDAPDEFHELLDDILSYGRARFGSSSNNADDTASSASGSSNNNGGHRSSSTRLSTPTSTNATEGGNAQEEE